MKMKTERYVLYEVVRYDGELYEDVRRTLHCMKMGDEGFYVVFL